MTRSPGLTLIGGGARSGKSRFALEHARSFGSRRAFVATAEAYDAEMRARIDAHREERGEAFVTVESPRDLRGTLVRLSDFDVVVVDCLTLFLSNLLLDGRGSAEIEAEVHRIAVGIADLPYRLVVVTNEVGMGLVPETPLGRVFRDLSGRAHQRLAREADEIFFATLGVMMRIHPSPVVSWRAPHAE